jgi:hypothetical protein
MLNPPEACEPLEVDSAVVAWSRGHEVRFRWDAMRSLHAACLIAYIRTVI